MNKREHDVMRELKANELEFYLNANLETQHASMRKYRDASDEIPMYAFEVDKGHENGTEIHVITDKASIMIFNTNTKKYITSLRARPAQITRYFEDLSELEEILTYARENVKLGLNNI